MNDEEYLEKAGIDATSGEPIQGGASAETAQTLPESQPKLTPTEMFELSGNKYPTNTEFQLTHNGKIVKVPYSTLANTWRQAAHMQDKYTAFNKDRDQWGEKLKEFDRYKGFYDKYGQLQEWSENNPDQWNKLWELYQNKDQHLLAAQAGGQTPNPNLDPIVGEISQLKQALGKYEGMFKELEQRKAEEAESKDIELIKGQISSFQDAFKEINIQEKDPDGLPLWAKIVQWGHANGYTDFESAAHMYLKDRIAETYMARAREEAMKGQKQDRMNGIVKRSATPLNQGQGPKPLDIKKMSYGDLAQLAKEELAAGGI